MYGNRNREMAKNNIIKKHYKINRAYIINFISVWLYENNKVIGGYIIPNTDDNLEFIRKHCKKEGYIENKNK